MTLLSRAALVTVVAASVVAGAAGQQATPPWPPAGLLPFDERAPVLTPEASMRTFHMPPGYRVELVASEPLVSDPILIEWDPEGRLWVIEMPGYMPSMNPSNDQERVPNGRIVVLEDTNDDGKMDKRTVFLDGLVLPRALKVLDRGVLVGEAPNLWFVRDENRDLKPEGKELVTNQYGTLLATPEHNANGLTWALDNWIHTSEHDRYLRYKDGAFEVARTLSRGQWGVTQDDFGRLYRNTNEASLFVDLVPEKYYVRNPVMLRTRGLYESLENRIVNTVWPVRPNPGVNRGYQAGVLKADGSLATFTAVAAPTVYRGDRLPKDLSGNVFVVEPAGNLVSRLIVSDDGTTLVARKAYEKGEFLAATDERFRPVHLSSAPDGTLYIVDLYRGIIQHRNYVTEYLRDHFVKHDLELPTARGRIYRVMHETTKRDTRPRISSANTAQLVALLEHPNGWRRDTAQRLLVERGDRSPAAVSRLVDRAQRATDPRARLHALWTLDGLDAIEPEVVTKALGDPSRDVRASAVRLSERWIGGDHPLQPSVLALTGDPDWSVRRQVAATLGELPRVPKERGLATILARYGDDAVLVDAALSGIRGSEVAVLTQLLQTPTESTPASSAITMLAGTIVRGAQDAAVQQVLTWTADTARPAWQRSALLRGAEVSLLAATMPGTIVRPTVPAAEPPPCPTCPGGRGGPGGTSAFMTPAGRAGAAGAAGEGAAGRGGAAAEPGTAAAAAAAGGGRGAAAGAGGGRGGGGGGRGGGGPMLRLAREPGIAASAAAADDEFSKRAAAVLARIEWPGKPGASAPVAPLTVEEQRQFDAGQQVYQSLCIACHQADGRGRDRVAPTLIGSALALAPAHVPVRILINGKEGSVGLMPPLGTTLTDNQIADVLTYIRREWGQTGSPVDLATVRDTRALVADRTRPWTPEELAKLIGG